MKVIIFTDTGVDDTFALLYTLFHPDIEVIAIVAGYGNVSRNRALGNIQFILSIAGKENIPIISGASRPLLGDEPIYYPYVHGIEGFGSYIPQQQPHVLYNFSSIFSLLTQSYEPVTIINIGRLTSLALAFILHSEILDLIQNIYVMGGAFSIPGNVTPYAEANIFADPTAASIVLSHSSPLSVHLLPLNVTKRVIFTPEMIQSLTQQLPKTIQQILDQMFQYYYSYYRRKSPSIAGAPLHDLVAAGAAVNPQFFKYIQRNVQIEQTSPFTKGVTVADLRDTPTLNPSHNDFSFIALDLDYHSFIKDVFMVYQRGSTTH
ncbi:nucleoside hydrolase [Scopulibacillus cellulosilyticus]|uniref:Nucleoside hydrolase n=1 Tax=Scopulibacillus cellulosilyticus TaxID=2665665 RepID=A0ABW2PU14_9BACL